MHFQGVGGASEYFVTSKDHKYNGWTPNAGLQYYAINSKPFQRVLKPLGRIEERDSKRLDRKTTAKVRFLVVSVLLRTSMIMP